MPPVLDHPLPGYEYIADIVACGNENSTVRIDASQSRKVQSQYDEIGVAADFQSPAAAPPTGLLAVAGHHLQKISRFEGIPPPGGEPFMRVKLPDLLEWIDADIFVGTDAQWHTI